MPAPGFFSAAGNTVSVRRLRRRTVAAAFAAVAVLGTVLTITIPGLRSVAAMGALKIVLREHGLVIRTGQIHIGSDAVDAAGVEIDDLVGKPVFSADKIHASLDSSVWLGHSRRRYGLISVDVERPALHLVRLPDGSYNVPSLLSTATPSPGAPTPAPMRADVLLRDGTFEFRDPSSTATIGRGFDVQSIDARGRIEQGGLTALHAHATYVGQKRRTPISLTVVENDRLRFAQATLTSAPISFAPIVDGIVATPALTIEEGVIKNLRLHAFAIGYDLVDGPQWQVSGSGDLSGGRFRVLPLTVPVYGVSGKLAFAGGHLSTAALTGSLEGAPVAIRGGLRLLGGVRLALAVQSRQSLAQFKRAFAFSPKLDIAGPVDIALRIDGEPNTIDVAGIYSAAGQVSYTGLPVDGLSGLLFYNGGHITIPAMRGYYVGSTLWVEGDIDLTTAAPSGIFDALATMPAGQLPIAANVNPDGTARAFVALSGPLGALEGSGFTEVAGGNGTTMRAAVSAGQTRLLIGPVLVADTGGGELFGSFSVDRTTKARTIQGQIFARSTSVHLAAGSHWLPGIDETTPIALPAVDGTIAGTVLVGGDENAPTVYINASADRLVVSGARLGHVVVIAGGTGGRVRIANVSIAGPDADLKATGYAVVAPKTGRYAAVLSGDGSANLGALGMGASANGLSGTASGAFSAALAQRHWTVAFRATSPDARVAGVRMETLDASLGGGGGDVTTVYAGVLKISGGVVSAMGSVPASTRQGGELRVWTDGVDLRAAAPAGSSVRSGHMVAVASVRGSLRAPVISGAASVVGGNVNGQQMAGDVNLDFRGDRLVASDGRIAIGGGSAHVSGTLSGLSPNRPASDAVLSLDASMREGDLAALSRGYIPKSIDLRGTVAASLHVSGTLGAPRATGYVDADGGTLQGVAFEYLRGSVAASSSVVQVNGGSVGLGSSRFAFSGSVSSSAIDISASSSNVDLSDFNDFFAGYDTLEGTGFGEFAFESTRTGVRGSGRFDITDASVAGFPLGTVNANFTSGKDQVLAHLRQNGDAGSSDLRGSVTFAPRRNALPDLRLARYDVTGSVRGADLGRIAPLVGRQDLGLSGLIDVDGSLRGHLQAPVGHADFNVRDGHIGKIAITSGSASVDTDGKVVSIRNASLTFPFAHLDGGGRIGPGNRIAASVRVDASDLATIVALAGRPGVATGGVLATVAASGSMSAPHIAATIVNGRGSALGVGFDRLSGKVAYAPGEVDIADAEVDLSRARGVISIGGTLPLQLQPFGLGPKEKRVDLTVGAKSVNVSAFDPLMHGLASLTGTLDAGGKISGTAGRPQVTGSARLRAGSVSSPFETVPVDNISADLTLARDTLTLSGLRGNLGRGAMAGRGAIHIVPAVGLLNVAGLQYWSRLDFRDAQINVPGWTSGSVNGNLRLTKSGAVPFLSGDLTLDDGVVPFAAIYKLASGYGSGPAPEAGPLPGLPELRPGHIVVYGGSVFGGGGPYVLGALPGVTPAPVVRALPSVDLAINAKAGRNVRVHGGAIDLTASGGIVVGGNLHAPTLAGSFTSTRGQIGYFDTNFRLVRGTVTFDPIEGLLPSLDVRAITNLNGVEITLTVTGRVDNLQTELSSNPSMSRDQIVATLLHAPQVASVFGTAPGQGQSALYAEAQSYFNAQLTRSLLFPVESLLAQTINVEQISLIYDQQGKVDVEVRKLITPTVYAIYRSSLNIPVTQTAGVAYSLRDYADLEILQTQSSIGLQQTVLNLRLTFH